MILLQQIFDVITNENARYKRNELESYFTNIIVGSTFKIDNCKTGELEN